MFLAKQKSYFFQQIHLLLITVSKLAKMGHFNSTNLL